MKICENKLLNYTAGTSRESIGKTWHKNSLKGKNCKLNLNKNWFKSLLKGIL
jgi:hypothetical protein